MLKSSTKKTKGFELVDLQCKELIPGQIRAQIAFTSLLKQRNSIDFLEPDVFTVETGGTLTVLLVNPLFFPSCNTRRKNTLGSECATE